VVEEMVIVIEGMLVIGHWGGGCLAHPVKVVTEAVET